jgi:hypothetical protein
VTKSYGATERAKAQRQRIVSSLYIKGLSPPEIARHVGVGIRTVERDIQQIKADFRRINEREQLRTWVLADAELGELWREGWVLFHRAATDARDDRATKIAILNFLRIVANDRNRLAFGVEPTRTTQTGALNTDEAVAMVINLLPTEMREQAIESVRKRIALLEKSP